MNNIDFVVKTSCGKVQGKKEKNVMCWLGVPYAKAPEGEMRFKKAVPCEKWEGVYDCTKIRKMSPQPHKEGKEISEDCLYVNIWSPKADDKKRPVFFYIHGGSFTSGSANDELINGANLSEKLDIVVVNVNFRLGSLGFMDFSFLGNEFEANCGLTDVIEALKWVRENISFFGGNPENVTIAGQSSGGTMAVALNCIEEAFPYFERTYALSAGPVLMVNQSQYIETAKKYLDFMGIKDKRELFEADCEKLVSRQKEFARKVKLGAGTFTIDIDGKLMKKQPIPLAVSGNTSRKPIYLSTTREEMSFLFIKPLAKALDVDDLTEAGVDCETDAVKSKISELYRRIYGKKALPIQYSDMIFRMGNVWFAKAQSKNSSVWMGRFDYASPVARIFKLYSFHSSDLIFLFGNFNAPFSKIQLMLSPFKAAARKMEKTLQKNLKEFMVNGAMPWEKVSENRVFSMCWDLKSGEEECVPKEIIDAYDETAFHERSFTGSAMDVK